MRKPKPVRAPIGVGIASSPNFSPQVTSGGGGPSADRILLESGDYILLESGDFVLKE